MQKLKKSGILARERGRSWGTASAANKESKEEEGGMKQTQDDEERYKKVAVPGKPKSGGNPETETLWFSRR